MINSINNNYKPTFGTSVTEVNKLAKKAHGFLQHDANLVDVQTAIRKGISTLENNEILDDMEITYAQKRNIFGKKFITLICKVFEPAIKAGKRQSESESIRLFRVKRDGLKSTKGLEELLQNNEIEELLPKTRTKMGGEKFTTVNIAETNPFCRNHKGMYKSFDNMDKALDTIENDTSGALVNIKYSFKRLKENNQPLTTMNLNMDVIGATLDKKGKPIHQTTSLPLFDLDKDKNVVNQYDSPETLEHKVVDLYNDLKAKTSEASIAATEGKK